MEATTHHFHGLHISERIDPRSPFLARLEATTCWDFPQQAPSGHQFGDNNFRGVTPSLCIYNLVRRFTRPGDLVVDCMAGSGTTVDVAQALGRRVLGLDIAPRRSDILRHDARCIPLRDNSVDLHIIDSPYSNNIRYSDAPQCLGKLSARSRVFYDEMEKVMREILRTLKPGGTLAWIISDEYKHGHYTPVGFLLFRRLLRYFEPVDIVCLVRRNDRSLSPLWEHRARRYNFFLRGFKYVFVVRKSYMEVSA